MPDEPLANKVIEDVVQAILQIDEHAGYSMTVNRVDRWKRGPCEGPYPYVSTFLVRDVPSATGEVMGFQAREMHLAVEVWMKERTAGEADVELQYGLADVVKAMMVDPKRGGDAIDTYYGDVEPFITGELEVFGFVATFVIPYRFLWNDPTQG